MQPEQQWQQQISGWWQGATLAGLAQTPIPAFSPQTGLWGMRKHHTGFSVSTLPTDIGHHHGGDKSYQDTTAGVFMGCSTRFTGRIPEGSAKLWAGT